MTRPIKAFFNVAILTVGMAFANHFLPVAQLALESMSHSISEITGK